MIERVSGQVRQSSPIQRQKAAAEGGFGAMLQQGLARQTAEVAFSKHAMTRAEEIRRAAEAEADALRKTAGKHLEAAAEFIVGRVEKQ